MQKFLINGMQTYRVGQRYLLEIFVCAEPAVWE